MAPSWLSGIMVIALFVAASPSALAGEVSGTLGRPALDAPTHLAAEASRTSSSPVYAQDATPAAHLTSPVQSSPEDPPMVHRKRLGLAIGGGVTLAVSWSLAALISIELAGSSCTDSCADSENAAYFWIPLAGPAIVAGRSHTSQGRIVFGTWSLIEVVGVTMFAIGLAGHDVPVKPASRTSQERPALFFAPMLARGAAGVAATARW
jgi:hypothetical protein